MVPVKGFTGNQLILVIQIQLPEFFTLQSRHVRISHSRAARVEVKGHAGFMKMAVQGFRAR